MLFRSRGAIEESTISRVSAEFRTESAGDSLYIYSSDTQSLLDFAGSISEISALHRKTGLEDVFLRLTGRELRS